MTDVPGIEKFSGAAILLLRWWVLGWSRDDLAAKSGVSSASIYNYEKGKTVPGTKQRKKIAEAMDISLAELDALAAAVQRRLLGVGGLSLAAGDRLAAEVAADLAADFHRATLPLVTRLAAAQAAPPQPAGTEEEIRALVADFAVTELRILVEKLPSLWRWTFVKLAGEESERAASVDAVRALELASLALWVAERVPGDEGWVCRVFSWAFLSNARRVGSDLDGAEEALACSLRLQAGPPEGRPELPELWRLLDLEASLRIDLRQLPEALRLLKQAEELAPQLGPIRARLLCKRSIVLDRLEELEGAVVVLREALNEVDPQADSHLFCVLQFNLAYCLTGSGQATEAAAMLPALKTLQDQLGEGLNQVRLRWLEGLIDAGLDQLDRAIETLSWVREAFAEKDARYTEAQAGMDLARLYLLKGWTAEVKRLVYQMAPVFKSKKVHVEAQKALALFRRAVELETATADLAGRVGGYLRRAAHDPAMVFEEAA